MQSYWLHTPVHKTLGLGRNVKKCDVGYPLGVNNQAKLIRSPCTLLIPKMVAKYKFKVIL